MEEIDNERAVLELSRRRGLIADLVKLGIETPALAWEGEPTDRKPCKRLADEPIADLDARVKVLSKNKPRALAHPEGADTDTEFSESQVLALSKETDPAIKARLQARFTDRNAERARN